MLDPAQLATLAAIHRLGSFEAAAAELGVTPPAISQRLRALEERLGTRLIRRGPPATATEAGLRVIRHHDDLSLLESQLARDLPGLTAGAATLRIAVNADGLATFILPALARVGGVLFDLVIDDQDAAQDLLARGEVLAAITSTAAPPRGCDSLSLGAQRYRATASPDFVAHHFPHGPDAPSLARAPALTFNQKDRLQHVWADRVSGGAAPRLPFHRLASSHGFVQACLLGLGWGMNPETLVAGHLAAGRLIDLCPDLPLDVALHWQWARLAAPSLAPLTAALRDAARQTLIGVE